MAVNFAAKFSPKVDERFKKASFADLITSNTYDWNGVDTVKVYSIPTVPMTDYTPSGASNRYGAPTDLSNDVQTMTLTQDRSWSLVIDRKDRDATMMTMDASKAVARQINEVVMPEYDTYVIHKAAATACDNAGFFDVSGGITNLNAHNKFLAGQEALGNASVPAAGRVCLSSYKFANHLMLSGSVVKDCQTGQDMVLRGIMGTIDGVRLVRVPKDYLPEGMNFMIIHPVCLLAPKKLLEYRVHNNPPGISGWLVEGRFCYDAFVLNSKKDAIYYNGDSDVAPATAAELSAAKAVAMAARKTADVEASAQKAVTQKAKG